MHIRVTMPIEDLARTDVVTVSPDTPIADVAETMAEEHVGSVVITDEEDLVGIVTDRDLTVRVLAEEADEAGLTAEDVMTEELCTIARDAGFYKATELMSENGIRRLPVCDGGDLVGIVTFDDLTELLSDEQRQMSDVIQAQRPEY